MGPTCTTGISGKRSWFKLSAADTRDDSSPSRTVFWLPDPDTPANQTEYARNLESTLSSIRTPLPAWHGNPRVYVDPPLQSADYCFVRNDGKKGSFELPYKVLSRIENFFTLDLGDRVDKISIDRLKAACMLEIMRENENECEVSSNLDFVPTTKDDTGRRCGKAGLIFAKKYDMLVRYAFL